MNVFGQDSARASGVPLGIREEFSGAYNGTLGTLAGCHQLGYDHGIIRLFDTSIHGVLFGG